MQRRITELESKIERLETELHSAQARARQLAGHHAQFDFAPVGYVVLDHAALILDANKTFRDMMGIPGRLAPRTPFLHFVAPEAQRAFLKYLNDCRAERTRPSHYTFLLDRSLGRVVRVELICEPVPTVAGKRGARLFRIAVIDRTQETSSESEMKALELNYQTLIDAVPGIVWQADAQTLDVLYVSRTAEFIFGYPCNNWYRTGFWPDHIYAGDRERVLVAIAKAIRVRARAQPLEYRITAADRKVLWVRDTITVSEVRGKLRVLGVAIEITDLKLLESRNLGMQEMLEAQVAHRTADLRETIGQLETFSYTLSHDLRAPLRAMQGYAQILQDRLHNKTDPQEKDFLERIVRSSHRMDELVQDVLKYNRVSRTAVELRPVNVEKVVADVVQDFPALQAPKAEVRVQTPLQLVLGHEALLTQCLSNLLTNAVKFVPPGVEPCIKIWTEPEPRSRAVRLLVQDNGIGIDPRDQKRIFGVFQRVHHPDKYEGTGIGLAIVQKAAERMGAKIGLDSTPGCGSTFWLQFQGA